MEVIIDWKEVDVIINWLVEDRTVHLTIPNSFVLLTNLQEGIKTPFKRILSSEKYQKMELPQNVRRELLNLMEKVLYVDLKDNNYFLTIEQWKSSQ